jgi:hypothetical protein
VLAELRERAPIVWDPTVETWLITRHEDVKAAFSDPRLARDLKLSKY